MRSAPPATRRRGMIRNWKVGTRMQHIVQTIVTGLAMGFIYCLVATEYTLIFNATGLVNFSHEAFIVLGAFFFAGTFMKLMSALPLLAIVCTVAAMLIVGVAASVLVFNPLRNSAFVIFAMFGTMMLSRIITELIRLVWGPIPFAVRGFLKGSVRIGSAALSETYVYIIVVAIVIVVGLQLFFKLTRQGKAMRCVAQNKDAAALMGINVARSINLTVGISAAICGVIGILITPIFNVSTSMASATALKGFCAGIVGGFGSYPGAIVGGLLIGLLEQFGIMVFPAVYKDVVAFIVMILFLLIRPGGIVRVKKG